jgi:hypothetical protein
LDATNSWRISPSEYSKLADTDFLNIALSASGLQRFVEFVGTTSNTIIKVEGTESAIAVRPTLGAGQVSLGSILVKDALIDPPVPDLSGYVPLNGTLPSYPINGVFRSPEIGGYYTEFESIYGYIIILCPNMPQFDQITVNIIFVQSKGHLLKASAP